MPIHTLYRRWRTGPLALVEAETPGRAVELAARSGVSLAYVDLHDYQAPGCFLPEADLRGADLRGARLSGAFLRRVDLRTTDLADGDLSGASLRQADLRNADLRNVDLRRADLRDARFVGADLRGVVLTGAKLEGAILDWTRAAFAVELLRRDRDCRGEALALVLDLAREEDDRPYAWLREVVRRPALSVWVGRVLGLAIRPGDEAPEVLRLLVASSWVPPTPPQIERPSGERFYWTRAVRPRQSGPQRLYAMTAPRILLPSA